MQHARSFPPPPVLPERRARVGRHDSVLGKVGAVDGQLRTLKFTVWLTLGNFTPAPFLEAMFLNCSSKETYEAGATE